VVLLALADRFAFKLLRAPATQRALQQPGRGLGSALLVAGDGRSLVCGGWSVRRGEGCYAARPVVPAERRQMRRREYTAPAPGWPACGRCWPLRESLTSMCGGTSDRYKDLLPAVPRMNSG